MTTNTIDARPVAPGDLIIAANVRADTKIDKTFVSSIKQHGVLVPIIATLNTDGALEVVDGQRRTLAAIEAGRTTVPVIVRDASTDADRVIAQLVVNDHRAELTDGEHAAAFKQLSLFGVSADSIARKTNVPKKRVETALAVAASDTASAAIAEFNLTLDQAAAIVEFEDNADDVAQLQDAAQHGGLDHKVATIRDRRAREAVIADAEQKLAAANVVVLSEKPDADWGGQPKNPVAYIEHPRGYIEKPVYADEKSAAAGKRLPVKSHETCPGRAVYVSSDFRNDGTGRVYTAELYEYCLDWAANGHHRPATPGKTPKIDPADMTDEQRAAAEKEKAERRRVLDNNKAWPLATEVRRTWISTTLLQQKTLPANADLIPALWAATALPREGYNADLATARTWLSITSDDHWNSRVFEHHLMDGNEHIATRTMLAIALAAVEAQLTNKDAWRSQAHSGLGLYLQVLQTWGYEPSTLELELIATRKATR